MEHLERFQVGKDPFFHSQATTLGMAQKATKWFGMRVTPAQKAKIERLAEQRGSTQKDAVMDAVEQAAAENEEPVADEEPIEAQPGSFLEAAGDLIGSIDDPDVPTDLSSNPKHMEGYGRD